MPRASAQPQASLYESTIENAELEETLEADALGEAPDEHSDAEWAELMEDDA